MDATHDPSRRSWVESANGGRTDFPVQNLPHGVFRRRGTQEPWRGGVAIGDEVLDLAAACAAGVFEGIVVVAAQAAAAPLLNDYMAMGRPRWRALRAELSRMLTAGAAEQATLAGCLVSQGAVEHALPARIGDYTDFFTSRDHMLNMGRLFMPDRPELPNFVWLPIAYHGRASTVEVSGACFARPFGQSRPPGVAQPTFGPSTALDY
jgi:fumarylacetoacetase